MLVFRKPRVSLHGDIDTRADRALMYADRNSDLQGQVMIPFTHRPRPWTLRACRRKMAMYVPFNL